MASESNKSNRSTTIESSTDSAVIRQYLEINFSKAELKGTDVEYINRNRKRKISIVDLIWELNVNGVMASYKYLKQLLTKR